VGKEVDAPRGLLRMPQEGLVGMERHDGWPARARTSTGLIDAYSRGIRNRSSVVATRAKRGSQHALQSI
jgi:hypothetical protein